MLLFASAVFVHPSKLRGTQSSGTEFLSALQSLPLRPASLGVKRWGGTPYQVGTGTWPHRSEAAAGLTCRAGHRGRQLALAPGAIPVSLNEQV